ncbi:hypothetical protein E4U56_004529 [Claviceps arundinis]|uniref:cyclin-dependent kinase n=1 Tax=Claviceps arundinis TaxID=1623583 RepID=A0A9P7SV03_9HYPO|nr:hypothetical protein E4U56_004529 [Claviceps arundinis]
MASTGKSRWADSEEDAELEAKLKQEKEEKRRRKAEKAEKARETDSDRPVAAASPPSNTNGHDDDARPPKRRRLAHEPPSSPGPPPQEAKLLRFEPGPSWMPCRSVENYDKLNDIEEGAYGWVARGVQRATGKVVALKRLKLTPEDRNGLPVTGLREIQILQDCRHQNVVGLEEVVIGDDVARLDNSVFLVLEFVEHDLKGILEDMPEPFLSSEIKRLLLQLTAGVSYLHENWILHRDLKTSNLLLNNRGQLKIADFGMARYVGDPPPPNLTQLVVTLWYRAPELLLGAKTYDSAVDMWSVGCIFGELITREPLLQGTNEVNQISKIFELCGMPTEETWPGFRKLPNAASLKLPANSKNALTTGSVIRARFPNMTAAGANLLNALLSLDPERRPSAKMMLQHEYFSQDPKAKPESLFPTFPSKAGQERRRRRHDEPNAPARGEAIHMLGDVDLSGIFQGRDREERGAGFALRMV